MPDRLPGGPDDERDAVQEAIAGHLPPAGDRQGAPGHDAAVSAATRAEMVALRLQGFTYEQIAERHGYATASAARQVVMRALAHVEAANVRDMRTLENARLDRAQAGLWPKVLQGDPRATDTWLRLSQRRARLNGLDAPVQVAISAGVKADLDDALADLETVVFGEVLTVRDDDPDDDPDAGVPALVG